MQKIMIKLPLLMGYGFAMVVVTLAMSVATMYYGYGISPKNLWAICGLSAITWVVAIGGSAVLTLINKD